jgi:hypothetical protein
MAGELRSDFRVENKLPSIPAHPILWPNLFTKKWLLRGYAFWVKFGQKEYNMPSGTVF